MTAPLINNSSSHPNLTALAKGSCEASEVWTIPELATSPTVHGRGIRHFFSIQGSESSVPTTPPDILSPHPDTLNANSYRYKVLCELYESEKTYVCNIETIIRTFLPALTHTMSYGELRRLIPLHLEALLQRHTGVLAQLSEQTTPLGMVGEIFIQLCNTSDSDLLSIYCAYLNAFPAAMDTLAKYEKSPMFCEAIQLCQQHCRGLSLAAYLLTPVQRLPRYELLLKEVLKHTHRSHADVVPLETALHLLRAQMLLLNKSIQSCQMSCLMGRSDTRRSIRPSRRRRNSGPSREGDVTGQVVITADIAPCRRTLSQGLLTLSFTSDSNDNMVSPVDNLAISCSDLTLDFKDTSNSDALAKDGCLAKDDGVIVSPWSQVCPKQRESALTIQPRITIGSPLQFRHVKHAIR